MSIVCRGAYERVLIGVLLFSNHASNWSADRVMKDHPAFLNLSTSNDEPIYFTGEMVSDHCLHHSLL